MTLEIELGHHSLFPAGDGNNSTAWGDFSEVPLWPASCPVDIVAIVLSHILAATSSPPSGSYLSGYAQKLHLDPAFHWGHCFVSLLPFLRRALEEMANLASTPSPFVPWRGSAAWYPPPFPLLNLPLRGVTLLLTGKPKHMFYVYLLDLSVVVATVPTEKHKALGFHGTIVLVVSCHVWCASC